LEQDHIRRLLSDHDDGCLGIATTLFIRWIRRTISVLQRPELSRQNAPPKKRHQASPTP